jgi:hypothetical protein
MTRLERLLKLIEENPGVPVKCQVFEESLPGDYYKYMLADLGTCKLDEIYTDDDAVYTRDEVDYLIDEWIDRNMPDEADSSYEDAQAAAEKAVNAYEWQKVILVEIRP